MNSARRQRGPFKVLVVEDTGSWRDYVVERLERHGRRIEVAGVADNTEGAVEEAKRTHPDVALVDLKLYEFTGNSDASHRSQSSRRGKHGVAAIRRMRHNHPDICILVMSQFGKSFGEAVVISALCSGIDGYIRKDDDRIDMSNLPRLVQDVFDGYAFFDDEIAQIMMKHVPPDILSDEESQFLGLVSNGKSDQEISDALKITSGEVRTHRRRIMECWRRLDCDSIMLGFDQSQLEEVI